MTDIDVVFPESGQAIVTQADEAVMSGEIVTWRFAVHNGNVEKVRIRFDGSPGGFFSGGTIDKTLQGDGQAVIWGTAPVLPAEGTYRTAKYTVVGLAAGGAEIAETENDPKITTIRPNAAGGGQLAPA